MEEKKRVTDYSILYGFGGHHRVLGEKRYAGRRHEDSRDDIFHLLGRHSGHIAALILGYFLCQCPERRSDSGGG